MIASYRDRQALERLGLGEVELHHPLDPISVEEQRRVLRVRGSAFHFEGKPFAAAPVLERITVFVAGIKTSNSRRGPRSGAVFWQFLGVTFHDRGWDDGMRVFRLPGGLLVL